MSCSDAPIILTENEGRTRGGEAEERGETGARGDIPPLPCSGRVRGGPERCDGAEQTLGLMRVVRSVRCRSGAEGVGKSRKKETWQRRRTMKDEARCGKLSAGFKHIVAPPQGCDDDSVALCRH